MTLEEFDKVIDSSLEKSKNILIIKAKEYIRNKNPLHNFEKGVQLEPNKSREDIIWGFALKHFISIQDIKDDLKNGKLPTEEIIEEKYTDLINYLLIEKASIIDKINTSK